MTEQTQKATVFIGGRSGRLILNFTDEPLDALQPLLITPVDASEALKPFLPAPSTELSWENAAAGLVRVLQGWDRIRSAHPFNGGRMIVVNLVDADACNETRADVSRLLEGLGLEAVPV